MAVERKSTRYAHSDGHTDVCYSKDGQKLITCGTDGDIRIWTGFDDDDPSQTCVGEWSLCVLQKDNHLYIATDINNVQIVTFPEAERDGILFRCTAPVNHMAIGKDHNFIALVVEDMEVKVINLSDQNNIRAYAGLTGPPLSVALCPKAKLVAVSCGDGQLRIWDVETTNLLKEITCVTKTNSFMNAKLLCRIDFDPISGHTLAYPHENTIIILNTIDWSEKLVLKCPTVDSKFSIVKFSPCGNLIAAASEKGELIIWNIATNIVIDVSQHPRSTAICSVAWNPIGNGEISFCDVQGQLGLVVNCRNQPVIEAPIEQDNEVQKVDFDGFQFDEDDDDDDENVISLEKLKNDTLGKAESELDFDKQSSRVTTPHPIIPEVPMQDVFMPSSTPEHLNPRYLCWNEVGIIRAYTNNENEGAKSIEIEFHDATLHNSMMLQNYQDYTMGCLSVTALVVANYNQITTIPLSAGTKEWNLTLADEEEIICIANSENLVCFATSNYLIRVCTIYGTQKGVFSISGPLLTMSAYSNYLLVAYHSAAPRKLDQCIEMMYVKFEGMSIESKDIKSALRPETTLQWLGFSDIGTPVMQDSYGLISLYPLTSNIWLPFCDTTRHRKNPGDGFFVTAVFESLQSVRGIRCRGSIYPNFTPRPTLSELPIEPPFIEPGTEKSQLEANLFTWSVLNVENVEKKFKETALKTFALACKNNLDQRAFELVEMFPNSHLLTIATKYATQSNRRRLAEKLMQLACSLQGDSEVDDTMSENIVRTPNLKLVNRKLTLNSSTKRSLKADRSLNTTTVEQSVAVTSNDVEHNVSALQSKSLVDNSMDANTQEAVFPDDSPRNPFLKSLKKPEPVVNNPLSLIDKYAGYASKEPKEKENKLWMNNTVKDKRKNPDAETDNQQKNKQRKLDKFMFKKQS